MPELPDETIVSTDDLSDIEQLPTELISEILSNCPNQDVLNLSCSSQTLFNKSKLTLIDRTSKLLASLVAQGKQDDANRLLSESAFKQDLLLNITEIKDYSGRVFYCTAYEYAYWAKDTHMRRMLDSHIENETKSKILIKIENIQKNGLTYHQNGIKIEGEKYFDCSMLFEALQKYIDIENTIQGLTPDHPEATIAWITGVGMAQRNLPAHYINEYCRTDRSFQHAGNFNDKNLPRTLEFYNAITDQLENVFPLNIPSPEMGLGISFAIYRNCRDTKPENTLCQTFAVSATTNLDGVMRLDKQRIYELNETTEFLKQSEAASSPQCSHGT